MSGKFLIKSRHGTTYYFRRRVPAYARLTVGRAILTRSLQTSNPRLAMIRGRALAAHTDALFLQIAMAKKNGNAGEIRFDYNISIDFGKDGAFPSLQISDVSPDDDAARINSHIKAFAESIGSGTPSGSALAPPSPCTRLCDAIESYYQKSQAKASTLRTYRSKLNHAMDYFGLDTDVLEIDQVRLTAYFDHVTKTIGNRTTQGLYMSTVATVLNWHRTRAGYPALTTKTQIPRKRTPDSEDRYSFTLEQLQTIFENAKQYRQKNPYKFWISVAPVFLGCRIEELCQVNLKTDLLHDADHDIWYFQFDENADDDGVTRKSMKQIASWRRLPIHSTLVRHGFVDFLLRQVKAGFIRPFEREWTPHQDKSGVGTVLKWSHHASKWGGRELRKLAEVAERGFVLPGQTYFHSMRHNFKMALGDAGISSEISEALSGRRYAGAEAERYEKLKQNHRRLSVEGIEKGLGVLVGILDTVLR